MVFLASRQTQKVLEEACIVSKLYTPKGVYCFRNAPDGLVAKILADEALWRFDAHALRTR
jgi:hypothetical protein